MTTPSIKLFSLILLAFICFSCKQESAETKTTSSEKEKLLKVFFEMVSSSNSGVNFRNAVQEDNTTNFINFEGVYNGAGVAIGDINNDGLPDIYFAGNSVDDKLYQNLGDFKFMEITSQSSIADHVQGWSTGVNMVDINADGYLDIYVCRSGPSPNPEDLKNKLFINNQNGTFTESAELYGINNADQSRQAAFFDYDLDGDLDMYLMNQPEKGFKAGEFTDYLRRVRNKELQTDYFYENVNGKFVDRTDAAGLVNFGYGHSIAVSDINDDGYPDFHITHDYDDPDYLYYNTGKKSFINKINSDFQHISWSSMGNDFADFNNDGLVDLFALEMAPDDHIRSKVNMQSMDPIKFHALADNGQHHQYMFNTLQLNNGNNSFSEIAQIAGIAKTEWSWSCLFFDIDNDGYKDLYISNGIKKDFQNRDLNAKTKQRTQELGRSVTLYEFMELIPSNVSENIVYKNNGDLTFKKMTNEWMDQFAFNTNGVAYGDLDNDGDLDLVTNNMEAPASIYKNTAADGNGGNWIKFRLEGPAKNPFALGTKIEFEKNGQTYTQELYNSRGYLSSMNYEVVFGLGEISSIENVKIIWPDQQVSVIPSFDVNSSYTINYDKAQKTTRQKIETTRSGLAKKDPASLGITFRHKENKHDDYKNQVLLPYSQSKNGPFIDTADVNGDGLEDFFIGGAAGQAGALYIQTEGGQFAKKSSATWSRDKAHEDLGVLFFDADNDLDVDLYIVSGGTELPENHAYYQDRLYINDGKGNFNRAVDALPSFFTSGMVVKASDIDSDGDLDLFVGGRIIPDKYPFPPSSHILINENGVFSDQTASIAPYLKDFGIISDALFNDIDGDGDDDLISVGEWSKITIHKNNDGQFLVSESKGLENSIGLWFSLNEADMDGDGDMDFIAGNIGLNTKFKANSKKEFHVFCDDFDGSGTYDIVLSNSYNGALVPVRGRECSSQQMPFISEQFESYQSFAEASLNDIIGTNNLESALHYQADLLSSVWVENLGDGTFEMHQLPNEVQFAPIMDIQIVDIDGNGESELITLGNHYDMEVETVRLDASIGKVLKINDGLQPVPALQSGLYASGNAKASAVIGKYLIIGNNDGAVDLYEIN